MKIDHQSIYNESVSILKSIYGPNAQFREGQYEAIEATMTRKRTLVVQKTGWGKSLVYFICTKLKRSHAQGMTLIISPLLVLMENQMEMASGMGLRCAALNSSIKDQNERQDILQRMSQNQLDVLFVTPETLQKDELQNCLPRLRIGLFVVDEAHCISDWGHDFRLEYGKLGRFIQGVFSNVAVLATTATANDRVVNDLKQQLGSDVYISRGPLTRESLHIQVLPLEKRTDRYAWLLDNLPKLPGTGIIYCLDRRDCDYVESFLMKNGISAMSYYSGNGSDRDDRNEAAMEAFSHNRIKAIVATIKLGMGYDKGDISFVIHFQSPANIVAWYQQIGRAGRKLQDAYVFLMTGSEDNEINEYFIRTAFPSRAESEQVMDCISNANGITRNEIMSKVNARPARVDKALYFMENERYIRKEMINRRTYYFSTPNRFVYNEAHYQTVCAVRHEEMEQMRKLINTKSCLSRFAVNCLDDHTACDCGKCANCIGKDIFAGLTISEASRQKAADFIVSRQLTIDPRKKWPDGKNIPKDMQLRSGICLSKYGDPGYGELVARGKYPRNGEPKRFNDQLVAKSASVLKKLIQEEGIQVITCVPSLRSDLVKEFTQRLAQKTGLRFVELLSKSDAPQQKNMENSAFQYRNAMDSFQISSPSVPDKVILVDDVVDSRWTLTVCGYKIMEKGYSMVWPFALADSSHVEE